MEIKNVNRYCNKCDAKVEISDLEAYSYQCAVCDEDLFVFEAHSEFDRMLDELYFYTQKQYNDIKLTDEETKRYVELADTLHENNVPITFGIEL